MAYCFSLALLAVSGSNVEVMHPSWNSLSFPRQETDLDEPMGSKEKWWVTLWEDDRPWLLKLSRVNTHDGVVSGEDWAEWLVQHIAAQLGIPTAVVRPARVDGERGSLSRSVLRDEREALVHGNSLLSAAFGHYDPSIHGENPGYTVAAVHAALEGIRPPDETEWPQEFTAYDVWAGYLVLDAWVAGRDRHHENWAVVERGGDRRLAPSFDHGNALGFQERDERRLRMLQDSAQFDRWISRGRSRHFSGRPRLDELAWEALAHASPAAREHWVQRLRQVDDVAIRSVLREVPSEIMSEVNRMFVERLLAATRRRFLDGYESVGAEGT